MCTFLIVILRCCASLHHLFGSIIDVFFKEVCNTIHVLSLLAALFHSFAFSNQTSNHLLLVFLKLDFIVHRILLRNLQFWLVRHLSWSFEFGILHISLLVFLLIQ